MSLNDLMSDYVARINNAIMVEKDVVQVLKNNIVIDVSKKLVKLGFLKDFKINERSLELTIDIAKAHKLKRVSKPGHRKYYKYDAFPKIVGGVGFLLITTSQGIKTQVEAHKEKIGGEVLFSIF